MSFYHIIEYFDGPKYNRIDTYFEILYLQLLSISVDELLLPFIWQNQIDVLKI